MGAFEKDCYSWMLAESVKWSIKFYIQSNDGVFKERRLKRLCYYMWKAWYKIIVKFKTEKNFCTFLLFTSYPLRREQNIATGHQVFCKQYSEKEWIESLYFPEGK